MGVMHFVHNAHLVAAFMFSLRVRYASGAWGL